MSRVQTLPYLRPQLDRIRITDWQLQAGDMPQPLADLLEDWDPNTPLSIFAGVEVDIDKVRADCNLSNEDSLRLALVWHSTGTGLRGKGSQVNLMGKGAAHSEVLSLEIEGKLLSDRLRLEVLLLLPYPGKSNLKLAPRLPGSILWRSEKVVVLEGQAARFPTEIIDFAASSWLPGEAAWFLDWDSSNLHEPSLGSFRLLINAHHQKVMQAMTGSNPDDLLIQNAIRFDVGRTMILGALENDDFVRNPDSYENTSIGAAIRRLLRAVFPNQTIVDLQKEHQQNPFRLECKLQAHLKLFQEQ